MQKDEKVKRIGEPEAKEFKKEEVLKIKGSEEKPEYWKPTKVGEKVEGKLIAISDGNFGQVLKISTKKGTVGINVGEFLKDIDFTQYAEMVLRFTFKGTVGKRGCRVFDVDRVLKEDEVPF